jgi:hypothetical protein
VLSFTPSEHGPKFLQFTDELSSAGLRTYWPKGQRPSATNPAKLYADAYRQAMPRLMALSLDGFASIRDGKIVKRTWLETANKYRDAAENAGSNRR